MKGNTMKPKRIIWSDWQVAACLRGDKTQHRIPLKRQPPDGETLAFGMYHPTLVRKDGEEYPGPATLGCFAPDGDWALPCPYPVGSEVWVAETWATSGLTKYHYTGNPDDHGGANDPCCAYAATATYKCGKPIPAMALARGHHKWRPPSTMPYWASRLRYTVAAVRCQRVQEISEADIEAEGAIAVRENMWGFPDWAGGAYTTAIDAYQWAWDATHGPGALDRNDYVWALTLERKPGGGA